MATRMRIALSLATGMFLLFVAAGVQAESHIRIVRLSYIDGKVGMERAGQGLERAILNAPIVEGTVLATGSSGLAEVEFENRSTLRLASDSEVKFRRLLMNDSGAKVNEIEVVHGVVYLNAEKSDDLYTVATKDGSFLVRKGTELRLTVSDDKAEVAVFKGEVQVQNQAQPLEVKKKQTLTLTANNANPIVVPGVDGISYDAWNNEREAYTSAYSQNESTFGSGPVRGYGMQDLNYYGSYFYAPGYGYAWQPYGLFGMAGWNPYMAGAWMYNAGMGYSFASAYPWGWLPYHYGSWAYVPNAGWAWLPGGGSAYKGTAMTTAFQAAPKITHAPAGFVAPVPPASMTTQHQTVVLGRADTAASIPGGRMPPNFRAVLPSTVQQAGNARAASGSTFAAANTKTASLASAHNELARPVSGHVFIAPTARNTAVGEPIGWGPTQTGLAGSSPSTRSMPMGTTSAGHATGHAGSGSQH